MRKFIVLLLFIFFICGCARLPATRIKYMPLDSIDPLNYTLEFTQRIPERMEVVNSIVFQYKWRSFTALGLTYLNIKEKTFVVSCMSPVGVKLFELIGDKDSVKANFVLKELLQRGDLPKAVGEDIRRIYFDNKPLQDSFIKKDRYRIIYTENKDTGVTKYIFAGIPSRLIEKRYYEAGRNIWSVYYYDYRLVQGKLYPAYCLLKNYKFGYKLFTRIKEIR
ncbi:MAG: DUF3261 domain-containing protein [Candidatus Omnitrophica bacterium]|nr:DUF3261 domain-containing protein [Candidatus Omnitrophota bacterium]